MPKISIPMATYRGAEYLKHVSIPSILNQTYQDWECIIVGDGTDDHTEEVIRSFNDPRFTYFNNPEPYYRSVDPAVGMGSRFWHIAGCYAMNAALDLCQGEFVARLDQDDAWLPNHLENHLNALENNPGLDVVYSTALLFYQDRPGHPMGMKLGLPFDHHRLIDQWSNYIIHASIMWRNSEKIKHLRYSDDTRLPADYHMWRNMRLAGAEFRWLPVDTVLYMQKCSVDYSKKVYAHYVGGQ